RLPLHVWPVEEINLAVWAYVLLLVLGLTSFVLNRRHLSGGRLLVWLAFAALSIGRAWTIPFFAIVAGAITAVERQEFATRGAATRSTSRASKSPVFGRVALLTAGLALLLLAWAGWLQGFYREARRPAWAMQPDPSLQRV